MKNFESFDDFINESYELNEISNNDPVLIAIRAAKMEREKKMADYKQYYKQRMKKRVYGKKRQAIEDELDDIIADLKELYSNKSEIFSDMENEAGQKGDDWTDDDANRYGNELNAIDDKIEKAIKKRQALEIKLAY